MDVVVLLFAAAYACLLQTAYGQDYQYSCIHYCQLKEYSQTSTFCCRMAKVFPREDFQKKQAPPKPYPHDNGVCPPVRDTCPRTRVTSPPLECVTDANCTPPNKCCYDKCLELYVCKKTVKRYRRSTSNETIRDEDLDPGAAQAASVVVANGGKLFNVVVDGEKNPVTIVEGQTVTVFAQGPVEISSEDSGTLSKTLTGRKKRSVKKESESGYDFPLAILDTAMVIKDKHGSVIVNAENDPVLLIQRVEGGPSLILNGNNLTVVAVNNTKQTHTSEGVATQTHVPKLKAQQRRRRRDTEEEVENTVLDVDGNPVVQLNENDALQVVNEDGVRFKVTTPTEPTANKLTPVLPVSVMDSKSKVINIALTGNGNLVTVNDGNGRITIERVVFSSESSEKESESTSTPRRKRSLAYAVVDGKNMAVTLVNASDDSLVVRDVTQKTVDVVAGNYLLDVGEAAYVQVKFNGDNPVLVTEMGLILMDKNGSPLTIKPANSVETSSHTTYCIVDVAGNKVNLVHKGELSEAYTANGNRITLCQGIYDLEVDPIHVSLGETVEGDLIVLQHGSALADNNGDLLQVYTSDARQIVSLHQNIILGGNGNPINLLAQDGTPIKVLDINGNELVLKPAKNNLITQESPVTAELEDNKMVLKNIYGEKIVDENGFDVTLSPAVRRSRRRAVYGYGIIDSLGDRVMLVDPNDVQVGLVDNLGQPISTVPGENVEKVTFSTAEVFESSNGMQLRNNKGDVMLDRYGKPFLVVRSSEMPALTSIKQILDGSGNTVTLNNANNEPVKIVDGEGEEIRVKGGNVIIIVNVKNVMIVQMDGIEVLVDMSGNILKDNNGERLSVTNVRTQATKVATNVILDGERNPVTLKTASGKPVTMLDDDKKLVIMKGNTELSADIPENLVITQSASETIIVDDDGFEIADDNGNTLTIKEMEEHLEDLENVSLLVDAEGTSVNLVDPDENPVTIVDENEDQISVVEGERTLQIESTFLRTQATQTDYTRKLLVDEQGNTVHSDNGPIEILPAVQDETDETVNLMVVVEEFVETILGIKHLEAVVEENNFHAEESSLSTYSSVFKEVTIFANMAGQLQRKCVKKMRSLLQGNNRALEAYSLLDELD